MNDSVTHGSLMVWTKIMSGLKSIFDVIFMLDYVRFCHLFLGHWEDDKFKVSDHPLSKEMELIQVGATLVATSSVSMWLSADPAYEGSNRPWLISLVGNLTLCNSLLNKLAVITATLMRFSISVFWSRAQNWREDDPECRTRTVDFFATKFANLHKTEVEIRAKNMSFVFGLSKVFFFSV